ncbi:hypothetical protein INT44_004277 [Umbelopsis vinacea]|uniref:DH domain-containing protein n=1 Tax=Umbelopsis vinacea TaxID=44442 RepID=A0A8H7QC45_9FUNG|nr:hypothetical protein INT44_004277 [Umbelopsis vinacea]
MHRTDVATASSTWRQLLGEDHLRYLNLEPAEIRYQEAVHEIIATEADYVNDLKLVYKIFIKEALEWEGLPKSVRLIFSNVYQIVKLHQGLLEELRKRQSAQYPVVRTITDKYRQVIPMFHIYAAYLVNFESAIEIIRKALESRSDIFGIYLRERNALPECRSLPLQAFLLKPVQRITKYPLFFRSLLECRQPGSPDHQDIVQLLHEIEAAIASIQNEQAKHEEYQKLEDLEKRIMGLEKIPSFKLAEYGRRLIVEGYLTLVNDSSSEGVSPTSVLSFGFNGSVESLSTVSSFRTSTATTADSFQRPLLKRRDSSFSISGSSATKEVYAFLFNDLILWTKVKSKVIKSINGDAPILAENSTKAFYGPHASARLKLCSMPAKVTNVVEHISSYVQEDIHPFYTNKESSQSTFFGGSLKSPDFQKQHSYSASRHSLRLDLGSSQPKLECQPLQFSCSVVHRNNETLTFQAATEEAKNLWCISLNDVLRSHVHRINETADWWKERQQQRNTAIFNEATLMAPPSYRRCANQEGVEVQDIVSLVGMLCPTGERMIPIADVKRSDNNHSTTPSPISAGSRDSSDESSLMDMDTDHDANDTPPYLFNDVGPDHVAPSPFMPRSRAQKEWQNRANKLAMGLQEAGCEAPGKVIRMKFGQTVRQRLH